MQQIIKRENLNIHIKFTVKEAMDQEGHIETKLIPVATLAGTGVHMGMLSMQNQRKKDIIKGNEN